MKRFLLVVVAVFTIASVGCSQSSSDQIDTDAEGGQIQVDADSGE